MEVSIAALLHTPQAEVAVDTESLDLRNSKRGVGKGLVNDMRKLFGNW